MRSNRVKAVKLLTLKHEFDMLKMNESEDVKTYLTKVFKTVNQFQLVGENFFNSQIMEKVMINMTDKFEGKINVIEESCNMSTLNFVKLASRVYKNNRVY